MKNTDFQLTTEQKFEQMNILAKASDLIAKKNQHQKDMRLLEIFNNADSETGLALSTQINLAKELLNDKDTAQIAEHEINFKTILAKHLCILKIDNSAGTPELLDVIVSAIYYEFLAIISKNNQGVYKTILEMTLANKTDEKITILSMLDILNKASQTSPQSISNPICAKLINVIHDLKSATTITPEESAATINLENIYIPEEPTPTRLPLTTDNKFHEFAISPGSSNYNVLYDQHGKIYVYDTKPLASGANGRVFIAADPYGNQVVIKKIKQNNFDKKQIAQEYQNSIKYQVNNQAFAKNIGQEATDNNDYILVLQHVDGQPFGNNTTPTVIENQDTTTKQNLIKKCLAVALEVEKLHSYGLFHGDLTPENIFVKKEDGSVKVTLIDFGAAKAFCSTGTLAPCGYSPIYTAPEILQAQFYALLGIKNNEIVSNHIEQYKLAINQKIDDINMAVDAKERNMQQGSEIPADQRASKDTIIQELKKLQDNLSNQNINAKDIEKEINNCLEQLHEVPHDFLEIGTDFKYSEAQEVYSLGRIFENSGLETGINVKNSEFQKLIATMTDKSAKSRPKMSEIIKTLERLAFTAAYNPHVSHNGYHQ